MHFLVDFFFWVIFFWNVQKKLTFAPRHFENFLTFDGKKGHESTALCVNWKTILVLWVIFTLNCSLNLVYDKLLISKMTLETTHELHQGPLQPIFWFFLRSFLKFHKISLNRPISEFFFFILFSFSWRFWIWALK